MQITILILLLVIICFSFVLMFGAPYLPTFKKQQITALELLSLKPGQLLIEPGCGDGRLLLTAAKKGIRGIGYELNPILFIVAKIVTWRHRKLISIEFGDFWTKNWPRADGIYVFLLQKYMNNLDKKIIQSKANGIKLASYAFTIPGKKPIKQQDGIYLYRY